MGYGTLTSYFFKWVWANSVEMRYKIRWERDIQTEGEDWGRDKKCLTENPKFHN